jgi:hypothetical protein
MSKRSNAAGSISAKQAAPEEGKVKAVAARKVVAKKPAAKPEAAKKPASRKAAKKLAAAAPGPDGMLSSEATAAAEAEARPMSKKFKRSIKALGEAAQEYLLPLIKKHGAEAIALGAVQVAARTKNSKLRAALLLIAPAIGAIKPEDAK